MDRDNLQDNNVQQEILALLNELWVLMDKYQVHSWKHPLKILHVNYQKAINERDVQSQYLALTEIKELFGGMGSFNDYVITHLHGDAVSESEEQEVNKNLNHLRHRLAAAVQSELKRLSGNNRFQRSQ
jgi:hypothetical protein